MNEPPPLWQPPIEAPQIPEPIPPVVRDIPFQFTGTSAEYFRIWIVNTVLSILSLGIYSAWAKVRTMRYFYRNTLVDGTAFDYLANPISILKGRLIVAVVLGIVFGSQYYSPPLYFVLFGLMTLATPWVVTKTLAFRAHNSAFRNVRLAFAGRVGETFGVYLKMFFIYLVTCGIGVPLVQWTLTRFVVVRHYYGDMPFTWNTRDSAYWKTYLVALALTIPGYLLFFGGVIALAMTTKSRGADLSSVFTAMISLAFFLYLLIPAAFLRAGLANLLYNGLLVGSHSFTSRQHFLPLLKLYLLNVVAIVFSLGLLIPWAKIRLARYRAETLTLHAAGDIVAESLLDDQTTAIGDGMTDLGDFDLGIGV